MKKWEYMIIEIGYIPWGKREKALNDLGLQGWEVICVINSSNTTLDVFLKREKDDAEQKETSIHHAHSPHK